MSVKAGTYMCYGFASVPDLSHAGLRRSEAARTALAILNRSRHDQEPRAVQPPLSKRPLAARPQRRRHRIRASADTWRARPASH